jgi:lectin-like protein
MKLFDVRSIVVGVSLLACLGCVPQRELSSYGEGAAPELDRAPDEGVAEAGMSGAGASPPAAAPADDDDEAAPTPMPTAAIEETAPSGAPLAPATMNTAGSEDLPTMPAPEVDAGASCAAMGGFTIAETDSCYMQGDNVFAWQDARSFCQAWGADLVEIDSLEENVALARSIDGSVWIGATDQQEEGLFRWVGGAPLGYAGWSLNQPNNLEGNEDCTELRASDERWSDVPCTGDVMRRALCERP